MQGGATHKPMVSCEVRRSNCLWLGKWRSRRRVRGTKFRHNDDGSTVEAPDLKIRCYLEVDLAACCFRNNSIQSSSLAEVQGGKQASLLFKERFEFMNENSTDLVENLSENVQASLFQITFQMLYVINSNDKNMTHLAENLSEPSIRTAYFV